MKTEYFCRMINFTFSKTTDPQVLLLLLFFLLVFFCIFLSIKYEEICFYLEIH